MALPSKQREVGFKTTPKDLFPPEEEAGKKVKSLDVDAVIIYGPQPDIKDHSLYALENGSMRLGKYNAKVFDLTDKDELESYAAFMNDTIAAHGRFPCYRIHFVDKQYEPAILGWKVYVEYITLEYKQFKKE